MAYYVILDSTANLVDSFASEPEGRAALEAIVHQEPESADEYALLTYGDDGRPTGAVVSGADVGVHA